MAVWTVTTPQLQHVVANPHPDCALMEHRSPRAKLVDPRDFAQPLKRKADIICNPSSLFGKRTGRPCHPSWPNEPRVPAVLAGKHSSSIFAAVDHSAHCSFPRAVERIACPKNGALASVAPISVLPDVAETRTPMGPAVHSQTAQKTLTVGLQRPEVSEQSEVSEDISVGDPEVWPFERRSPEPTPERTPLSPLANEGIGPHIHSYALTWFEYT